MTKEDVKKLLATITAFYPNFKLENPAIALNGWLAILEEYETDVISKSLKAYVTGGHEYAPNPGQLIQLAFDLIHGDEYPDEGAAWDMYYKALSDSTWHAKESFDKLPPIVQKVAGSPSVLHAIATDNSFNASNVRRDFSISYRAAVMRDKEERTTPSDVKAFISEQIIAKLEDKGNV